MAKSQRKKPADKGARIAAPKRPARTAATKTAKRKSTDRAESAEELAARLDRVLSKLMRSAGAGRCTLRIDDAQRKWSVALPCSEARRAGAASLKVDGSINQRAAATARWIDKHRRNLIQPDVTRATDPAPPPALLSVYGVKAQMLSPIFTKDGWLQGWISVHYLDAPHAIGEKEIAALDRANAEVRALLGL